MEGEGVGNVPELARCGCRRIPGFRPSVSESFRAPCFPRSSQAGNRGALCTQSYVSGFNKVRSMSRGQESVRGRWRRQDSGKASWRRWHFSWSLKDRGGKVKRIYSFDHLFNENVGVRVPGSVRGLRMCFVSKNRHIL